MKNTIVLPFERNRYFTGKMLTSQDFLTEQTYMNNKRRFINRMTLGKGIICGLSVVKMDETTIRIESGAAIDGAGREMVIPEGVIKKLSAVEGYRSDISSTMKLMISYDEKGIQPVYSVNKSDKKEEYEYNRVTEGIKVFVTDDVTDESIGDSFLRGDILYEDRDFLVKLTVPSVVCAGKKVKIRVSVVKLSDADITMNYMAVLQFTTFVAASGLHEEKVIFENEKLAMGQRIIRDIWVTAQESISEDSNIVVKASLAACRINDEDKPVANDVFVKVATEETEPDELVSYQIGKRNYEARSNENTDNAVCIAKIRIRKINERYEIEEIIERGVKQYIELPSDKSSRQEYMGYFDYDVVEEPDRIEQEDTVNPHSEHSRNDNMTTGIIEIPVGRKLKKGDIVYSDEAVHGLGKGSVYITIACEAQENHPLSNTGTNVTIIGKDDIFPVECNNDNFDYAVKINNDKGSFVVGIKAKRNIECTIVKYRWYAISCIHECVKQEIPLIADKRIIVETPTVVLEPGEKYFFEVRFSNLEETKLGYELVENGSGSITTDGIYTAPEREGVFEIRIFCLDNPAICTYAYAIVKRKK